MVKVKRDALFLHAHIATKDELRAVTSRDASKFLKNYITNSEADFSPFEKHFTDPAMVYLCKCALQIRTALFNSGKFRDYLNAVREAQELEAYVSEEKVMTALMDQGSSSLALFMQDALLLLAVSDHAGAISAEKRDHVLSHVLSLVGTFMLRYSPQILHNHKYVNFAGFVEAVKPLPMEYLPQDGILGKINADRLLKLMDTHRKEAYDMSKVCTFLGRYKHPQNLKWLTQYLKMDDSLQLYLRKRVSEVFLLEQLVSTRHGFGYIYNLPPKAFLCNILMAMEQVTYQLNYLFRTLPSTPVVKESILVEYASLSSPDLAMNVNAWLDAWRHAFRHGLTEVMDYQVTANTRRAMCGKLRLLKLYFCDNDKRMAAVLELEEMLEKLFN